MKDTVFLNPEPLPKIAKGKKDRWFPWELAAVSKTLATNRVRPTFLPAAWWLPRQVLVTQNEANKKGVAVPGRERIGNQWLPESRFTSHNSKTLFSKKFFLPANLIGMERTMWNFTFFSWPGSIDRDLEGLSLVWILTLC